jgi:predicted KAP-like P-loop ATPase
VKRAFGDLLQRLSEIAPITGAGADLLVPGIGSIFRAGGTWSNKISEKLTSGRTLDDLRTRLRDALAQLPNQQILVVIDDLDRLTPAEALEMVSTVKSLGDLPNVVYLLSYDETKLSFLIERACGINGHEFLQKIVQYSVHIPTIEEDLSRIVSADLTSVLKEISEDEQRRLGSAWHSVLRTYLRTPRDIRRFTNSLAVARSGLADYTDAIDLMLMETFRLFEPDVYQSIRRHITDLTS